MPDEKEIPIILSLNGLKPSVSTSRHTLSLICSFQKAFNSSNSRVASPDLPISEGVASQTVCLPIYPEMSDEQINYVIDIVNKFYEGK